MDRLTPKTLLLLCRLGAVVGAVGMAVLMLGPFQGLEQVFGLNDKAAHALAFYAATLGLFLAAPRTRRVDLALYAITFGLVVEIIQGLTGREMSLTDFLADFGGAAAAVLPGMIERLRHHVRTTPSMTFAEIRANDGRRHKRRRRAASPANGISAEPQA